MFTHAQHVCPCPTCLQHTGTLYSSSRSAWLTAVALSACLSTLSLSHSESSFILNLKCTLSHSESSFILNLKCKCLPP